MPATQAHSAKYLGAVTRALWELEKTVQELHELVAAVYQGDCEAADRLDAILDQSDTEVIPKSKND